MVSLGSKFKRISLISCKKTSAFILLVLEQFIEFINNSIFVRVQPIYDQFYIFNSSALNKFHSPLNHRNHSFEIDFRSSTLFPDTENPLSLSAELCLTSLSSDSGILTAKLSDISNSGEFDKSPIQQQMENSGANLKYFDIDEHGNKNDNGENRKSLSRSDSVRARASMFQAMEEQRSKTHMDDGQRLAKCKKSYILIVEKIYLFLRICIVAKSYVAGPLERSHDFDTKNNHRNVGEYRNVIISVLKIVLTEGAYDAVLGLIARKKFFSNISLERNFPKHTQAS